MYEPVSTKIKFPLLNQTFIYLARVTSPTIMKIYTIIKQGNKYFTKVKPSFVILLSQVNSKTRQMSFKRQQLIFREHCNYICSRRLDVSNELNKF